MKRFQGGLVFEAHRLVYHSALGLGVIKKKSYLQQLRVPRGRAAKGTGAAPPHHCQENMAHIGHVQRFRGGLVFKAHRLCVSLNSRLESNKEEEE